MMIRSNERELFLKYIRDVCFKNSNLSISSDIIYYELSRFNVCNDEYECIINDSLVGVQVALNNKFKGKKCVNTFTSRGGYFWCVENRCGKSDKEFYSEIESSVKLYVSIHKDNIYKVSESLFNFMIKENIAFQCKVSKEMRNDSLVCRVAGRENVIKVSEYLNNLKYKSKYKPNPFLLDNGKVSVELCSCLVYNRVLSSLLYQYLCVMKSRKLLDKISCNDFSNFVREQRDKLNSYDKDKYMEVYNIFDNNSCSDFVMICDYLSKNLDNNLTIDDVLEYKRDNCDNIENKYLKQDEDKVLYVINYLSNYYSAYDIHNIMINYINSGDIRYFTRKDDIRYIISNNFSPIYLKNIISSLGWRAFISVSKCTYDKYGEEQLTAAIKDVFCGDGFEKFTNDNGVRSRLALIIPYDLLREIFISKLEEKGMSISNISLTDLVLDELVN